MRIGKIVLITFFLVFYFSKASPQEPEKLKIYYQPAMSWAPIIIAYEEGYFKEYGIDLELIRKRDAAEALILLLQGSLDIMAGSPPTAGMYNAIREGKSIKLVAGIALYARENTFAGIAIIENQKRALSKSDYIKKIKGQKISLPIVSSLPHYLLEKTLQKNGLLISEVELISMDFPLIAESLRRDVIYAGFLMEPFITVLRNTDKIAFISFGDEFPGVTASYLIYGQHLLNKNPMAGVRFMAAYLKGCKQYNEGKTKRNIEIVKKYIGIDEALLTRMDWPVVSPEGVRNTELLGSFQNWLLEKNYIAGKIDINSMIDTSFLEKAKDIITY